MGNKKYAMVRMWEKTRDKLRLIKGITGQSMIEIVDNLANQKLREMGINEKAYIAEKETTD